MQVRMNKIVLLKPFLIFCMINQIFNRYLSAKYYLENPKKIKGDNN